MFPQIVREYKVCCPPPLRYISVGVRVKSVASSNPTPVLLKHHGKFFLQRVWEVEEGNQGLSVLQGLKFSLQVDHGVV